ncbi:MAG: lytic transglycosylase [Patescibacteria group bacterium]|nr:lytic transglycosylase [Patescibacteria group bacterium]MDD4611240.1 lytic transglycosylase [Patescibacteria group bacterium]
MQEKSPFPNISPENKPRAKERGATRREFFDALSEPLVKTAEGINNKDAVPEGVSVAEESPKISRRSFLGLPKSLDKNIKESNAGKETGEKINSINSLSQLKGKIPEFIINILKKITNGEKLNRREVLVLGAVATTLGLGSYYGGKLYRMNIQEDELAKSVLEKLTADEKYQKMLSEQEEAEAETEEEVEPMSIQEIFDYEKERIEFDDTTVEAIKNYWKKKYGKNGKLYQDFKKAYYEMGAWEAYLKEIFAKEGVPEQYLYLAIPESHWNLKAKSGAGAVGPYQFMASTAVSYKLKINNVIDERLDPLESARACAKNLKYLYGVFGDWNIALSGYNGGLIWEYKKEADADKKSYSYRDYQKYIERSINGIKDELEKGIFKHEVEQGHALGRIARRYGSNVDAIGKINNLKKDKKGRYIIGVGQILEVPVTTMNKEEVFWRLVSAYRENLDYPAKLNAISELIKNGEVISKKEKMIFSHHSLKVSNKSYYLIRKGGNLADASKKLGIDLRMMERLNPNCVKRKKFIKFYPELMNGTKINLPPDMSITYTLEDLARKTGRSVEKLATVNPAIKDFNSPLPMGYTIRVLEV